MPATRLAIAAIIITLLILYACALLFIFLYSLAQAHLVYHYLKAGKKNRDIIPKMNKPMLPHVTVQLPLYNEMYVAERLIDAVCGLDYPKEKLEIQLLDDSTDETVAIVASKVVFWKALGYDISQVRRQDRQGFKAGALKEGLASTKGEFIALFDADFIPEKQFLLETLTFFDDLKTGMVQTRWQHLNKNYSWLTKLQAFGLDAHFTVEQTGRNKGHYFMNFNGTAGIWRKACILDAGNWHSDTLTEDLDLSYRAQLKGWKFIYLEHLGSPAELPPVMSALKTQQYRWSKGGAEVARKQLAQVWKSNLAFAVKWHATFHLLNSTVFLCILLSGILSVPLLFLKATFPEFKPPFILASLCLFSFIILGSMYWVASKSNENANCHPVVHFFKTFPFFLSVMMGLSLHNSIAVAEGFAGRKTPFIRTPKFNINHKTDTWKKNRYLSKNFNLISIAEACLSLYFLSACALGIYLNDFGLLPLHCMLAFGFGSVFYFTIQE